MSAEWMAQAACASGHDPDMWSPDGNAYLMALEICRTECPVVKQCLAHALAVGEDTGIWGGTTPKQRRELGMRRLSAEEQPYRFFRVHTAQRSLHPPKAAS